MGRTDAGWGKKVKTCVRKTEGKAEHHRVTATY